MSDREKSAGDERARLEGERLKAEQVAQHGGPAAKWWAQHFVDALDLLARGVTLAARELDAPSLEPSDDDCARARDAWDVAYNHALHDGLPWHDAHHAAGEAMRQVLFGARGAP